MSDDLKLFEAPRLLDRCQARTKLVTERFHVRGEYDTSGKLVLRKVPLERATRWVTCQLVHGHPGRIQPEFHLHEGSFQGVRIAHSWTDEFNNEESDITEKWTELKSLKEGR